MCRTVLLAFVLLSVPLEGLASVRINEIAWMGTDAGGANCEWIELFNTDSQTVDLSGWSLSITNTGNTTAKVINLSEEGSVKYTGIAGNGFYLIARNSGACTSLAPATSADWLGSFGNGISNSGATIRLFNGAEEVDSVNAEEGWTVSGGVGGKNTSGQEKQTPQRSGNGWVTAPPTPRSVNASAPVDTLPDDHDDTASSTPVVTIGGTTPTTPVASPLIKLFIEPGVNRIVSAGAETPYEASVYDATGKIRAYAEVTWNFGDGTRATGRSVRHVYDAPGEYLVVVRAREKGQSAVTTLSVVASPAEVAIGSVSDTGITLQNKGSRLLDLSSWKVAAGKKKFTLPEDTAIPGGGSLLLSAAVSGLSTTSPALLFPGGKVAAVYEEEVQPEPVLAGIEEEQEVEPAQVLALTYPAHEDVYAPAAAPLLAAAGAAVPPSNVVLKKEGGLGSFVAGLLDSLGWLILP